MVSPYKGTGFKKFNIEFPNINIHGLFDRYQKEGLSEHKYAETSKHSDEVNLDEIFNDKTSSSDNNHQEQEKSFWEKGLDWLGSAGATIAVATTSVVSGVLDIGEAAVDGVTWTGGKLVEGGSWLVGKAVGIVDKDAEKNIMNWREDTTSGVKDFIKTDWIGEASKTIYENTEVGKIINDASYLKYDSKTAQGIRNVTTTAVEIAGATALTVCTGGAAAPLVAGTIVGLGKASESMYEINGTDTTFMQELGIAGSGVLNGLSWMANGQLGQGALNIAKDCATVGAKNVTSTLLQDMATKDFWFNALREGLSLKNQNGKLNINATMNYLTSAFGTAGSITPYIIGEEEFDGTAALKIAGTYINYLGLNIAEDVLRNKVSNFNSTNNIDEIIETVIPPQNTTESTDITKYLDEYLMNPDKTPPMGIPATVIDYFQRYQNNPDITDPDGIPIEVINYIKSKTEIYDTLSFNDNISSTVLSSELQEYLNKIKTSSEFNSLELKAEILSSTDMIDDPILKAKKLYNELNKRVSYDTNYFSMAGGELPTEAVNIYETTLSFDTITSDKVVCKGWSELYRELLLESGYKDEQIHILGGKKVGSHKWIAIDLGDGNSIIADATNAIKGKNDLYTSKMGLNTKGFLVVPSQTIGTSMASPVKFYKYYETNDPAYLTQMENYTTQIDSILGYADETGYEFERISKAKELFGSEKLTIEVLGDQMESYVASEILQNDIPSNIDIDGFEAYVYFKDKIRNTLGSKYNGNIKNNAYQPRNNLYSEPINVITIETATGPIFQIYSKNTGKIIIDSVEQFNEFISEFKLLI